MSQYNNEMRGALFRIPEDKLVDRGPGYSGHCEIHGVQYQISAWLSTSKTGKKYFQLRFQPKQERDRSTLDRAKRESQRPLSQDIIIEDDPPL